MLNRVLCSINRDDFLWKLVFGFLLGCAFGMFILIQFASPMPGNILAPICIILCFGFTFLGLPYVWGFLPSVWSFGMLGIILFPFKIAFAAMIGLVVVPITLIYRVISTLVYLRRY